MCSTTQLVGTVAAQIVIVEMKEQVVNVQHYIVGRYGCSIDRYCGIMVVIGVAIIIEGNAVVVREAALIESGITLIINEAAQIVIGTTFIITDAALIVKGAIFINTDAALIVTGAAQVDRGARLETHGIPSNLQYKPTAPYCIHPHGNLRTKQYTPTA